MENNSNIKKRSPLLSDAVKFSFLSILLGLLVGAIVLIISGNDPLTAYGAMIEGIIGKPKYIAWTIIKATPYILTGLSIAFAFKTGLFNIGASGQFTMGGFAAIAVGITLPQLGSVHWVVALLAAVLAGALWAVIPGLLKAFANINEVIACIMMNYIGMYAVNWAIKDTPALFNKTNNRSNAVASTANIPKFGLDKIFTDSAVNGGFIIALLAVVVVYVILTKTTFGYELKAVGFNRDASKYAGINEKKSITLSMAISGALAGLGGGLLYLAGSGKYIEIVDEIAAEGFDGISVALLGLSSPLGILLAGLFIAYIRQGGFYLQLFEFSQEIIDIIVAVIIYFSAFSLIVRSYMMKRNAKKAEKLNIPETPSPQIPAPLHQPIPDEEPKAGDVGDQTTDEDPQQKEEGGDE